MAGRLDSSAIAPAPQREPAERPETLPELSAVGALPILVVDDLAENRRTLEAVLAPLGYPLRTAASGAEALRLLLEDEFGLILLDVHMPDLDGLETAELIKGRERTRDIPIVFLTASRDEVGDIVRGYGGGVIDYVLKPFDPELLRSKVAVFAELEASRRALKRSEAFLRGTFEAAPVGKTVLDGERRIVRANPAFARFLGREPGELVGVAVSQLCHPEDREALGQALDAVELPGRRQSAPTASLDLRLVAPASGELWMALVASSIETAELGEPLLLAQWVDLSIRRRAEEARADLLVEQAARVQAEAMADRLQKLQALTEATETLSLDALLGELADRLLELFNAETAEIHLTGDVAQPASVRATRGSVERIATAEEPSPEESGRVREVPLRIERSSVGFVRLLLPGGRSFSGAELSLLHDAAERAALGIRRAQLHEEEHHIAVVLQHALLPGSLPSVPGLELAVHYQAAGLGAEVGGDWYDAFELPQGRLGIVLGDVAGRSIPAASAMGQLRTVTRAFALLDDGAQHPGQVLSRLARYHAVAAAGELFTLVYVIIDPSARSMAWAAAGHPPPLLRTSEPAALFLEPGDALIGIEPAQYRTMTRPLAPGETVILYTDGLVERRGESLDAGLERLADAAAAGPDDAQELCRHLLRKLLAPGEQLRDDVTALIARMAD